ncbi:MULTISPECIES: thiamine pyrophosphate-binding protein [unclassified Moorena]|uniref:thiamine pyrophosphate-binding protein n=1 Tax=unclassified Moorena TaxID=2683338 RepID=UPI0013C78DF4|nr:MULTISPECIES: thiamine pyrophosphate-binding protein [unclassified Moorena]NEO18533.1 thiamine pyrophosphate-binding protein [Moorena sp. SIO4A5]NEQ58379.1 thiamine pyrophosphate-binding protein [Moorena sp. SIO4A1]
MKLVDALVQALISLNVPYVFGVSGANIEHLHDAIHRLGNGKLQSIMAKSEDGAAFMADCRARVHQTLGVCCSTSGGGMMNLIAGIAESYSESVPVLALVGQPPSALEGRGAFQDSSGIGRTVDAIKLWGAVTKYVAKISNPDDFWHHLTEAIKAALSNRPGPAVLLFPRDIYEQEVEPCPENWARELRNLIRPKGVPVEMIRPLFEAIRRAKNPVLILGHGVRRCSAPEAVVNFVRAVGLPVVTTLSGRGEFPNDDPLYLGTLGVAGHPSVHAYLKEQADLFVVVGAGLNLMTRQPLAFVLTDKKIAVVNVDVTAITRIISPALVVEADAGMAFQGLLALFQENPFQVKPLQGYMAEIFKPLLAPPIPSDDRISRAEEQPLLQSEAITIVQDLLPESGHVLYDAGNCAAAALHMTRVPAGASSTIALGMGGMGYAIPGAIGAQLGSPRGTRTVIFAGDGAFLMTGLEIHTAVDLGLPILFIVFNNNMHGMCVTRQQLFFESRLECVRYAPVNIAVIARGLGTPDRLWVGSAGTVDELQDQLKDYRNHTDIPGVLELRLLREEMPPFTPFIPESVPTIPIGKKQSKELTKSQFISKSLPSLVSSPH